MRYKYTMRFSMNKLIDLIETAVGRRPDSEGNSGWRGRSFTFNDVDLTPQERQAALDALPETLRLIYTFTREELPDEVVT